MVDGAHLGELPDDDLTELRRRRIGFVFQFFNLIPVLNAIENASLPLRLDAQTWWQIWTAASGREVQQIPAEGRVESTRFSIDGAMLITCQQAADNPVLCRMWEIESGLAFAVLEAPADLPDSYRTTDTYVNAAISPDGISLAMDFQPGCCIDPGWTAVYSLFTMQPTLIAGNLANPRFSPDNQQLAGVYHDPANYEHAEVRVFAVDELPAALAVEQVVDAVRRGAAEHERAHGAPDSVEAPGHVVPLGDGCECLLKAGVESLGLSHRRHLQTHEEAAGVVRRELLALFDVAASSNDCAANGVHNAWAVDARESQYPLCVVVCGSHHARVADARIARSAGAGPIPREGFVTQM